MGDLLVEPQRLIRFFVRRKTLLLLAAVCLLPTAWCRQQQLLQKKFFRRGFEIMILSLLVRYFRLNARAHAPLIQIRTPASR